ncbi:hypothetical protein E1A91_A03G049000v1 [Gossypium mustelinum]|uniref:Uncharacterized protein n=2 Tax=Gossypium TaxID=3633 RepID=A0A5D2ZS66_GOSMU|nr:hypothetical protein ES288_A03G049100v1 [Gossypium darwinii]TYJ41867.1 hypothetical protein E1A91_A03G049000v1 [Gossypium mustelinum]
MMRPGRRSMAIPTGNAEEKKKGVSRFRMFPLPEKLVHAIPLILFLCVFILWLLSRPVNVEVKDGKIVAIHHMDMPFPLTDVPIMPSDSTSSPIPSVPLILTGNETEAIERIIASE